MTPPEPGREFWEGLERECPVVIDRPRGSRHLHYPELVYPLDMANQDTLSPNPSARSSAETPDEAHGKPPGAYVHAHYERKRRVLRWMITHIAWRFMARIDDSRVAGLEYLPPTGPAILMINHIAFVDPIVVMGNLPRNVVPLAKAEVYHLPVWGIFPKLWHVIPVHRAEMDRRALERALQVLAAGEVILIAPEATRHDALAEAREGVAYLGHKSGAPIIPVAIEATSGYPTLIGPWNARKPGAYFRLGPAFRYKPWAGRLRRERLRLMTDEALYQLAALLPEFRRGHYADLERATTETIEHVETRPGHAVD